MRKAPSPEYAMPNSARVLNLYELTNRFEKAYGIAPPETSNLEGGPKKVTAPQPPAKGVFFQNPTLNRSVIIKHRLNPEDQTVMLNQSALVGTKIFVPFAGDSTLDRSGKYMYLGQRGWDSILREHFGIGRKDSLMAERDMSLLETINRLPSLDPFLLRDRSLRDGYGIDDIYFRVSASEHKRLKAKIIREFHPLATVALQDVAKAGELANIIVMKIWEATDVKALMPLIQSLDVAPEEANEVFFAWKGFLYYKICMTRLADSIAGFLASLENATIIDQPSRQIRDQIDSLKPRVVKALRSEYELAAAQIEIYNNAYRHEMIRLGRPRKFTDFLHQAPRQFESLGASVAAIDHAQTTWRSMFGSDLTPLVPGYKLLQALESFAHGLPMSEMHSSEVEKKSSTVWT